MIDFATLQGLEIPEGVVTKIEDEAGNVLWSVVRLQEDRAVLTVAKQTNTTYAGETAYADESFVLLDIYPLSGGTVSVTYGGLTKTITDDGTSETPNAQQVYFGTFNGVNDSTPDSGTLTIEGNFASYGCGSFIYNSKSSTKYCSCITGVTEFGEFVTTIPTHAFYSCTGLTSVTIPDSVTSIGDYAFYECTSLALTSLPEGITSIGAHAFGLKYASSTFNRGTIVLPSTIQSIDETAFLFESSSVADYYYWSYRRIVILATTPPALTEYSYETASIEAPNEITVPVGCGATYKAAEGWSDYASKIVEAS